MFSFCLKQKSTEIMKLKYFEREREREIERVKGEMNMHF